MMDATTPDLTACRDRDDGCVLVVGATGFIGSAVVNALLDRGHRVVGLGRNLERAREARPEIRWVERDLRRLCDPETWRDVLVGIDSVINASGVLQDGLDDDVVAVQRDAMLALYSACENRGVRRLVQISAVGASPAAATAFMRTKADADEALRASRLEWIILRPGLVIGPAAYGGTAMLRAIATIPGFLPLALEGTRIQTVALGDVAEAVALSIEGGVPTRTSFDLVESASRSLPEILVALRSWLGVKPARRIAVPDAVLEIGARIGDLLARLGWRPPLRSTALIQLRMSIVGDSASWIAATGSPLRSFAATLRSIPTSAPERWAARLWLLKPMIFASLAMMWTLSGAIGLIRLDVAKDVLTARGWPEILGTAAVVTGSLIDIALGIAIAFRPYAAKAVIGMVALSVAYIAAGTIFTPGLWLDPLGPLLKIVPTLMLTLVACAIMDDR